MQHDWTNEETLAVAEELSARLREFFILSDFKEDEEHKTFKIECRAPSRALICICKIIDKALIGKASEVSGEVSFVNETLWLYIFVHSGEEK